MFPPKPKNKQERQQRKEQLTLDMRSFHLQMNQGDPNREMTEEELAECRRLVREQEAVGFTEGDYLQVIRPGIH